MKAHKARRCIVHVGFAKTGSTAIQHFLSGNRALLLEREGILYPGTDPCHSQLQALFSRDPAALVQVRRLGLADDRAVADHLAAYRSRLEEEIAARAPRQILISSEYFVSMSVEELVRLREYLLGFAEELSVLAYLRDPWSYPESYVQQCLRDGSWKGAIQLGYMRSNLELAEFVEKGFGVSVDLRPYLTGAGAGFDVVRDFLGRIGVDASQGGWHLQGEKANEAIGFRAACLLSAFNELRPIVDAQGRSLQNPARDWSVQAICRADRGGVPIRISAELAQRIREDAQADLERIQEKYFAGDEVFFRHYDQRTFGGTGDRIALDRLGTGEAAETLFTALDELARRAQAYWEWARNAEAERHLLLALEVLRRGGKDRARDLLRKALGYRPDYPQAKRQLAQLDAADDVDAAG